MRRAATRLFPVGLGVWTSRALTCAVLLVASAPMAQGGINVWTSNGTYAPYVEALAIAPRTPSTLYAGTTDGVFDIELLSPPACVGDCHNDGHVTVDEIPTMINIALGNMEMSECDSGDANRDGQITVDEILTALNKALTGCPLTPEQGCLGSGGTVTTDTCCATTGDFPDTCGTGACTCPPDSSHEVYVSAAPPAAVSTVPSAWGNDPP